MDVTSLDERENLHSTYPVTSTFTKIRQRTLEALRESNWGEHTASQTNTSYNEEANTVGTTGSFAWYKSLRRGSGSLYPKHAGTLNAFKKNGVYPNGDCVR